ncbi:MAG: bifunctional DNA primase/polymerase [Rhodoplanes sp.]|uniref:VapE domain-containing protein n=1 Tax=Rhodoplanes sp. TaxID=1968906 RepID=UPI00181A7D9E|nr:VapE domain-containing protein [Rhodoplanes sp.]NVO13844.1 bifunctional DNA primase/polymerase [Rhodoplanes sp.]
MPETNTLLAALRPYAAMGAALFPIPAGSKDPTGIVGSFADDWSPDPAQWMRWAAEHPGCNFGIVAGPSNLIIADIDVAELGRDRAWQVWAEWCAANGLPALAPHVQSARGGWHVLFRLPEGVEPSALKQVVLVGRTDGSKKAVIDLRVGNGYVVAAGSYYNGEPKGEQSGSYVWLTEAPPHPAPAALLQHCARVARTPSASTVKIGTREPADVAALVRWLNERGVFVAYDEWIGMGMALRIEFGDDGIKIWRLTHDANVTAEAEASHWDSFATEPVADSQTLSTWLQKANNMGWTGSVRRTAAAMFAGITGSGMPGPAPIAAAVTGAPAPAGYEDATALMAARGTKQAALWAPIVEAVPRAERAPEHPTMPDSGHPLRDAINAAIPGILATGDLDALAVVRNVHPETAAALVGALEAAGSPVDAAELSIAALALQDDVEHGLKAFADFQRDAKTGLPENDNSDNVGVFLQLIGAEVRWNGWLDRPEIQGFGYREWTFMDDYVVARLLTRACRTGMRFRPAEKFFWNAAVTLARENHVDPALDLLADLESKWDGVLRLDTWLSVVCDVTDDAYHRAVGANVIGGMVRRMRHPGCKHDTMAVFIGRQGSGKSTMASILALRPEWFTDAILFGTESKELVLALAGKSVVEISEMGMRNATGVTHVKAMLSRQVDEGRTAYARSVTTRPRRNVMIGTTNDEKPLSDPTGNRRFLPVWVGAEQNLDWLQANLAQIVGEAAVRESTGETFAIPRDTWARASEQQERARGESDMDTVLQDHFGLTKESEIAYVSAKDLVDVAKLYGWRSTDAATAARGVAMERMGFQPVNVYLDGKRSRGWLRGRGPGEKLARTMQAARFYEIGADGRGRPTVQLKARSTTAAPTGPAMLPLPRPA